MQPINYFQAELDLVEFLKTRVGNCKVMAVNDYWDVLQFAPELTESRMSNTMGAVLIFYGGDTVISSHGCDRSSQVWHLIVCSKNLCDLKTMAPARKENGEFVSFVIKAMRDFSNSDIRRKVERITPQNFPIAERLGVVMTALSYRIEAPF